MGKRVLAVDAYNAIEIFVKLGLSFEEIAALGFRFEDEPDRKLTPELMVQGRSFGSTLREMVA